MGGIGGPRAWLAGALQWAWAKAMFAGAITEGSRAARRFGRFGEGAWIAFPPTTIYNERYIWIGRGTRVGPQCTLSVGMAVGQVPVTDPVIRIGDRCLIGRGSGIVGHLEIVIGDDVFFGHHVYVTDQNHGYEDLSLPIGLQTMPERPVHIGAGSWVGHGAVILPGARIGRHCVIGAGSVVRGEIPDFSVAVGNPARVVRRFVEGQGWVRLNGAQEAEPNPAPASPQPQPPA